MTWHTAGQMQAVLVQLAGSDDMDIGWVNPCIGLGSIGLSDFESSPISQRLDWAGLSGVDRESTA